LQMASQQRVTWVGGYTGNDARMKSEQVGASPRNTHGGCGAPFFAGDLVEPGTPIVWVAVLELLLSSCAKIGIKDHFVIGPGAVREVTVRKKLGPRNSVTASFWVKDFARSSTLALFGVLSRWPWNLW